MLTRPEFEARLAEASAQAVDCARDFVRDRLPEQIRYRVLLNRSHDRNRREDEVIYPEDEGVETWLLDRQGVVDLLWRDGTCPVWVDVRAIAVSTEWTILELFCAGRYSSNDKRIYYPAQATRPFSVKSPWYPIWWGRQALRGRLEFDDYQKWRLARMPPAAGRWLLRRAGLLSAYMGWAIRRQRRQWPRRVDGSIRR